MQIQTITLNGKVLTNTETLTLRMALAMVTIDLEELDSERKLDGLTVLEHLKNIGKLRILVGDGQ